MKILKKKKMDFKEFYLHADKIVMLPFLNPQK